MKYIIPPPAAALIGLVLMISIATPAAAQLRPRGSDVPGEDARPKVVLSGHGLMYLGFGRFYDPPSRSEWAMADAALGGGAGLHIHLEEDLWIGGEGALARTRYERRPRGAGDIVSGHATVGSGLVSVRLGGRGLGRIGRLFGAGWIGNLGYVTAGAGVITYRLDDLGDAAVDFMFSAGGGLEYMSAGGHGFYLEIKQIWGFHEREGVESGTVRHSRLDLGLRTALRRQ